MDKAGSAESTLASRLLAHPACSLNARQAKNRGGTQDGLRCVAVDWSLLARVERWSDPHQGFQALSLRAAAVIRSWPMS